MTSSNEAAAPKCRSVWRSKYRTSMSAGSGFPLCITINTWRCWRICNVRRSCSGGIQRQLNVSWRDQRLSRKYTSSATSRPRMRPNRMREIIMSTDISIPSFPLALLLHLNQRLEAVVSSVGNQFHCGRCTEELRCASNLHHEIKLAIMVEVVGLDGDGGCVGVGPEQVRPDENLCVCCIAAGQDKYLNLAVQIERNHVGRMRCAIMVAHYRVKLHRARHAIVQLVMHAGPGQQVETREE